MPEGTTVVKDGESWEDVAGRTLGNRSLGAHLAATNGAHESSAPSGGAQVQVPGYPGDDA